MQTHHKKTNTTNRKILLTQLGGTGLLAMMPLTKTFAAQTEKRIVNSTATEKIVRANKGVELRIFGNPQMQKVVGTDTGNQIFEWIDDLSPPSGIPQNVHTKENEIFRVMSGQVEMMIDNKATILKEGDMAYAPKKIVHSWKVVADQKADMWVSAFPSGMELMFHELHALPPCKPDFETVANICDSYRIKFV